MQLTDEQLKQILSATWLNISQVAKSSGIPRVPLAQFLGGETYKVKDGTIKNYGLNEKYKKPLIDWVLNHIIF
jgi:predicted transcriptional regulator